MSIAANLARSYFVAAGVRDFSAEQCEHILDIKELEFRIPRGHTRILSGPNNQVIQDRTGCDCVATIESLRYESALPANLLGPSIIFVIEPSYRGRIIYLLQSDPIVPAV